jgi:hypothetical protein
MMQYYDAIIHRLTSLLADFESTQKQARFNNVKLRKSIDSTLAVLQQDMNNLKDLYINELEVEKAWVNQKPRKMTNPSQITNPSSSESSKPIHNPKVPPPVPSMCVSGGYHL